MFWELSFLFKDKVSSGQEIALWKKQCGIDREKLIIYIAYKYWCVLGSGIIKIIRNFALLIKVTSTLQIKMYIWHYANMWHKKEVLILKLLRVIFRIWRHSKSPTFQGTLMFTSPQKSTFAYKQCNLPSVSLYGSTVILTLYKEQWYIDGPWSTCMNM